jgi:hypothetical protein
VFAAVRILVNPDDPADVAAIHHLQDAIKVTQPGGPGRFDMPNFEPESQTVVRDALVRLAETTPDLARAFGRRNEVDALRHLMATAARWGGNPERDTFTVNVVPPHNDGTGVFKLVVPAKVPVDGFWSVTVYDAQQALQKNALENYAFNSITAKKNADGSATIQFGGCNDSTPNCLPIAAGWIYTVRLYRPRPDVLSGQWKFPQAQAVDENGAVAKLRDH